jgi:hypothetical protein
LDEKSSELKPLLAPTRLITLGLGNDNKITVPSAKQTTCNQAYVADYYHNLLDDMADMSMPIARGKRRMADIYINATVAIAASAAKKGLTGFLGDRDASYSDSCTWTYGGRYDGHRRQVTVVQKSGHGLSLNDPESSAFIDTRG